VKKSEVEAWVSNVVKEKEVEPW